MNKDLLKAKIATSKREVAEAEERLDAALRDTQRGPRAEKTAVTDVVREALTKLRVARAELEELDRIVSHDE